MCIKQSQQNTDGHLATLNKEIKAIIEGTQKNYILHL